MKRPMEVLIRLREDFQKKAGTDSLRVSIEEGETVDTLLIKLGKRYASLVEEILDPRTGEIRENIDVLLNNRHIQRIRGIHTKLKDKDCLLYTSPSPRDS